MIYFWLKKITTCICVKTKKKILEEFLQILTMVISKLWDTVWFFTFLDLPESSIFLTKRTPNSQKAIFLKKNKTIYLCIWLCWVWVAILWIFIVAQWLSCPAACGILVPWPGIEPASFAMEGGFLTTGPPGKSQKGNINYEIRHLMQPIKTIFCSIINFLPRSRYFTMSNKSTHE